MSELSDCTVQAAGDAIVTADATGTITPWNPAAERLLARIEALTASQGTLAVLFTLGLLTGADGNATGAVPILRSTGDQISFV
ncbi:MAG TPA: hypothetical protein VMF57_00610 [Solirubrobacteraceae bacterium]|nr:hypothetical protein [Solirubrobacteraceae bacterium]